MRNLVVCCDGTWNTAEQRDDGVPVPTNAVRVTYKFSASGEWLDHTVACGPDGTNDGEFQIAEAWPEPRTCSCKE